MPGTYTFIPRTMAPWPPRVLAQVHPQTPVQEHLPISDLWVSSEALLAPRPLDGHFGTVWSRLLRVRTRAKQQGLPGFAGIAHREGLVMWCLHRAARVFPGSGLLCFVDRTFGCPRLRGEQLGSASQISSFPRS